MKIRDNDIARPFNRYASALERGQFEGVLAGPPPEDMNIRARGAGDIARYAREIYGRKGVALTRERARRGRDGALAGSVGQGGSSPDAAKIEAASIVFGTMLNDRINNRPESLFDKFAMVLRTNKLLNRELWINNVPKMRLWEGDKVLQMFTAEGLTIVTRPHEASIVIPKRDLINDGLGLYTRRINGLAESWLWHLDEMFVAMLIGGMQGTALGSCYDGQNLFDTDHTYRGNGVGVQYSNKVGGAFSATVYRQAWDLMYKMKDDNGLPIRPAGGRRWTLLHGPTNRDAVRTVLKQDQIIGTTQSNLDKGTAEPLCSEWLTAGAQYSFGGTTITCSGLEWFLIPNDSSSIIIQIKRDVEFLAVDRGDDEFSFRTGKLLYGIESEDGAAYGMPQEIIGGPGA